MSKLVVGIPVIEQLDLTQRCLSALADSTQRSEDLTVVIVDNGNKQAHRLKAYKHYPFNVQVIANEANRGYYYPLRQLSEAYPEADLYGLIHNDLFIYGEGWDEQLGTVFENDPRLGMVGFCGSDVLDERGGRGGGTMCWFRGAQGQSQAAGLRINDLRPALILDSLAMFVRPQVIPKLGINKNTPLCHFVDKLWPIEAIAAGWRVGVLGIEVDHMGGQTAVGIAQYEEDAKRWCAEQGLAIPVNGSGGTELYLEAERRFLRRAQELGWMPSYMNGWLPLPLKWEYGRWVPR